MTTGILGDPQASLGNIVLGGLPGGLPGTVYFAVLVISSKSLLVIYTSPMSDDAIIKEKYTLFAIDSLSITHLPSIASVSFNGINRSQVIVNFQESLTFGRNYTLSESGISTLAGDSEADSSYNFLFTVPDPPRALQAYLSGLNTIDVLFDRPVSPYTSGVTGTLKDANSSSTTALTQVVYSNGAYPVNCIRLQFSTVPTSTAFTVNMTAATDVSLNSSGAIAIPLTLALLSSPPYNTAAINAIQPINAYVDHVSNDYVNHAFIDVFFNGPLYASDAVNPSNWTVTQKGAHLNADSADIVSAANPSDVTTLITLCTALRNSYNAHLSYPGVHVTDGVLPTESQIITSANILLHSYVSHIASTPSHTFSTNDAASSISPARTLSSAISNLNVIRTAYNVHRLRADIHAFFDTSFTILNSAATDIRSAALLSDELKIKMQMHFGSSYWHAVADVGNVPTNLYLNNTTVYEIPTDLLSCSGALTEVRDKYLQHLNDSTIHTYSDTLNTVTNSSVSVTHAQAVGSDISVVGPASVALKTKYNLHLAASYSVPIVTIRDYTNSVSIDASDPYSYLCELEVQGSSLLPSYSVQANVRNASLSSTYNGTLSSIRNLQSDPALLSCQSYPEGEIRLRFDREIPVLPLDRYSVQSPINTSPVSVMSVRTGASLQCLTVLINDIMTAYQLHLILAGHKNADTQNVILNSDFPSGDLLSLIAAVNYFKFQFNYHASSDVFHTYGTNFPIKIADCGDLNTAFILAQDVLRAFLRHNSNLGLHTNSGPTVISAKKSDELIFELDGVIDSDSYSLSFPVIDRVINLSGSSPSHRSLLTTNFQGIAAFPVLSAAIPQSGFALDEHGHPSLVVDSVLLIFSKPMRQIPITTSVVTFSGSITMIGASWVSDRLLSIQVTGMGASSYNVSVTGMTDIYGNSLVTNP